VKHNMPSAQANPDPVEKFLATEVSEGRVIGLLRMEDFPHVQTNRFGVIPKRNQPNKWRLILDLSSPTGTSVNDGISPELCSIRSVSIKQPKSSLNLEKVHSWQK